MTNLVSAVIEVAADGDGALRHFTGPGVHGMWFDHWERVDPAMAKTLHSGTGAGLFTLSPLMDLPAPRDGLTKIHRGKRTWLRLAIMGDSHCRALLDHFLPRLPARLQIGGLWWSVVDWTTDQATHAWAGIADKEQLCALGSTGPQTQWPLQFITPTAFGGSHGVFPIPLPEALVRGWAKKWTRVFGEAPPSSLDAVVRSGIRIRRYELRSEMLQMGRRKAVGGVGKMEIDAPGLSVDEKTAFNSLAHFAFFCGSGHHTTQGMGMTRLLPLREAGRRPHRGVAQKVVIAR